MKKTYLIMTAVFVLVLTINSSSLMAQTPDAGAKTDRELASENAVLRKRVEQLERQNAQLRGTVRENKKKLAVAPASMNAATATDAENALAADLPVKAHAPLPLPVVNWTGFYIGANVGYGWNYNRNAAESAGDPLSGTLFGTEPAIGSASTSFNTNGWAGGLQAGYNWQFHPRWVAGIEADFAWSDIKGGGSASTNLIAISNAGTFNASQKVDWFGTVRVRFGYLLTNNLMNDLLIYATGGLAYGKVSESANVGMAVSPGAIGLSGFGFSFECANPPTGGFVPTCFAGNDSRISTGWTVGGGAEHRFAQNFSVKVEYLYVNLGSKAFNIPAVAVPDPATSPSILSVRFDDAAFHLVRAGVNYRF